MATREIQLTYSVKGNQSLLEDTPNSTRVFSATVEQIKDPTKLAEMAKSNAGDDNYDLYVRANNGEIYHLTAKKQKSCLYKNTLCDEDINLLRRHSNVEVSHFGYEILPNGLFEKSTLLYVEGQKVSD